MNVIENPAAGDHFVQLYDSTEPLADAVATYVRTGLARGEAAVVIATPEHRAAFLQRIEGARELLAEGRLNVLDAERTLARFMANGMPEWKRFHEAIGGLIAELRLRYPVVRAYGEMVDVLWQRGEREAATRLEEYWNELGRLQSFSLFCAYRMDPLASETYQGGLQCVCKTHTHLLPARDERAFDDAVWTASRKALDEPLAQILLSLAVSHRPPTQMTPGQATLFWLHQNMPRTAEKILTELRGAPSPEG
jgi:hypothetical protein